MRLALAALLAALAAAIGIAAPSVAVTRAPCTYHGAVPPYVDTVEENTTIIAGAGSISGCPKVVTLTTESVKILVELQHLEDGSWITYASAPYSGSANRYTRFWNPPRAGGTIHATCLNGDWRTHVTGGDGYPPYEWDSTTVTFTPGDSGVCGSYGGGD